MCELGRAARTVRTTLNISTAIYTQECPGTMNDVFKFPVSVTLSCEHTQQCAIAGVLHHSVLGLAVNDAKSGKESSRIKLEFSQAKQARGGGGKRLTSNS